MGINVISGVVKATLHEWETIEGRLSALGYPSPLGTKGDGAQISSTVRALTLLHQDKENFPEELRAASEQFIQAASEYLLKSYDKS